MDEVVIEPHADAATIMAIRDRVATAGLVVIALAAVLAGKAEATGRLPVDVAQVAPAG